MIKNMFVGLMNLIRKWTGRKIILERKEKDEGVPLDGSQKDLERAASIRAKTIEEYDKIIKKINAANRDELRSSALRYFGALKKHVLGVSQARWFVIKKNSQLLNPRVILGRWDHTVKNLLDTSGNLRTDLSPQEIVDVVTKMMDLNKWDKCGIDVFMGQNCKSYTELRRLAVQKNKKLRAKRQKIYDKTEGHCAYCGAKFNELEDMTVDHVIPSSRDMQKKRGIRNNLPACLPCNHLKADLTVKEFKTRIKKLRSEPSGTRGRDHAMKFKADELNQVSFFFEDFGIEI